MNNYLLQIHVWLATAPPMLGPKSTPRGGSKQIAILNKTVNSRFLPRVGELITGLSQVGLHRARAAEVERVEHEFGANGVVQVVVIANFVGDVHGASLSDKHETLSQLAVPLEWNVIPIM